MVNILKHFKVSYENTFYDFTHCIISILIFTTAKNNEYLLIRISSVTNGPADFYRIQAEAGCKGAQDIYALKKYNEKKNAVNTEASFYNNHRDSAITFFNYFISPTEALNFIASKGFTLHTVFTQTTSGSENVMKPGTTEYTPVTTVFSYPVYCFMKNR
jgi:hypothetical protein